MRGNEARKQDFDGFRDKILTLARGELDLDVALPGRAAFELGVTGAAGAVAPSRRTLTDR